MRLNVSRPGRWSIAAAVCVALGVVTPLWAVAAIATAATLGIMHWHRHRAPAVITLAVLAVAGSMSAAVATAREDASRRVSLPSKAGVAELEVREDTRASNGLAVGVIRSWDGAPWKGPRVAVDAEHSLTVGDVLIARGVLVTHHIRVGDEVLGTVFRVTSIQSIRPATSPVVAAGNRVRDRVRATFDVSSASGALMVGLLVGDTDHLDAHTLADLRLAGLAHYVAVSGSNVALFLGAVWVIAAPLAVRPVGRAVIGMVGLAVFAVATRWEASVIRASVMAAIPLVGGPLGLAVDAWTALGVAATVILLAVPALLSSLGFQLSVLATLGVMVGVGVVRGRGPAWLWMPLGATIGAQAFVAPLIVAAFGTIPLAAPLANLVAGPLVAAATVVGLAAVVVPWDPIAGAGEAISSLVLLVANVAADGPQLGATAALVALAVAVSIAWRPTRALGVASLVVVVLLGTSTLEAWPEQPRAVVMDVGQGDAILVQDPSGASMLVDGGRDPQVLDRLLREFRVDWIDVVVATHGDSDHVAGIEGLLETAGIGTLLVSAHAKPDEGVARLLDAARDAGVTVELVSSGAAFKVGSIPVEVIAPSRRFASDNDGSIVLLVGERGQLLLPGDIGSVAQAELPPLMPEVLVVPHHGASTTDLAWLDRTVARGTLAILSYGPNTYGHPHPDIVDRLVRAGAEVRRTEHGHVVVPLG